MTDTLLLEDYFGQDAPIESSENVYLLPLGEYGSGDHTLTANLSDFDEFEVALGVSGSDRVYDTQQFNIDLLNETIAGTSSVIASLSFSNSNFASLAYVSDGVVAVSGIGSGGVIRYLIGKRRRYTTRNAAIPIVLTPENTTGGTFTTGRIGVAQEYVLEVATVLGIDYLNTNLVLDVELLINGKWAPCPLRDLQYTGNLYHYGLSVYQDGNSIKVITAGYGVSESAGAWLCTSLITNPWALSGPAITLAQCRVTAVSVQQYVTNNTLDLITALEARIAALET